MTREQAEKITIKCTKNIYGFALKRCSNLQDAEDITQEIVLKVFRVLLYKDDIQATDKFIWTVAHNTLVNYYRDKARTVIGIPIDESIEALSSEEDILLQIIEKESIDRLHMEIAYLSKLQRRIVIAYYFENKKQEVIATELGIPLSTVKWHLFEAKNDLKKGMEIMRKESELKFNPIKFALCGTNGSIGTKGSNSNFFRSTLSQNIVYSVWKKSKRINEIAEKLGVSPVYIESEVEYLEEYGFLTESKGNYLCNILLDEPTDKLIELHDRMYIEAAKIFANELYDELYCSKLLDDENSLVCNRMIDVVDDLPVFEKDKNFIMWSLIAYIAALSGEALMNNGISFEEASTIRPDGGQNVCYASILNQDVKPPLYFDSMMNWCGPCWNANNDFTLWQIDSEWSTKRVDDHYQNVARRALDLLSRHFSGEILSEDDYAYLYEKGYMRTLDNKKGLVCCISNCLD